MKEAEMHTTIGSAAQEGPAVALVLRKVGGPRGDRPTGARMSVV